MKIKYLSTELEYNTFCQHFYHSLGIKSESSTVRISKDYLTKAIVMAAVDRHGRMQAGFIIGQSEPFRLLEFVPFKDRNRITLPRGLSWDQCCEIACVWKKPSINPVYMSAVFWPRIGLEVLKCKKIFVLGHNQSKNLDKFYSKVGHRTLYKGPSSCGLPSRLVAYSKDKVFFFLLFLLLVETPRRLTKGLFRKKRINATNISQTDIG